MMKCLNYDGLVSVGLCIKKKDTRYLCDNVSMMTMFSVLPFM